MAAGRKSAVVRIPGLYWHGFGVVGDESATMIYFANGLYDYDSPDEVRSPPDTADIPG